MMLSIYICEGIFILRIYVTVTSPYARDRGVTGWYQSLGSHIFGTTSRQINDKRNLQLECMIRGYTIQLQVQSYLFALDRPSLDS